MVRTGNPVMDQLVYEMAFQQFGDALPLREAEPYTGTMEITFVSSDQSAYMGSSTSIGATNVLSSGWYTGKGHLRGVGVRTSVSSGTTLIWQNSTMMIVLKKATGERLWSADYNYKGGWEMSGFVVNTPDEAARLVLSRLKENFLSDFE